MQSTAPSPYFIGWKATLKRWAWYLLITIFLWCTLTYINHGNIPFGQPLYKYILEIASMFTFIESLYWAHLLIINTVLPKIARFPVLIRNIIELLAVWISGVLCSILFIILPLILIYGELILSTENARNFRTVFTIGPIISLVLYYFVERTKSRNRLQKEELRMSRLEKENYQAQLQGLKNQVSPHFLFNSLNTLTSIIPQNSEKAVEYTHRLSDLYRYYLRSAQEDLIVLSEELKILEAYQFLLKMRLGNRVKFSLAIDEHRAQASYLPPMVIQECIENAIKHNRATKKNPLQIEVDIKDNAVLITNNKLLKKTKTTSTQTGWKNIKKRYDLLGDTLPEIKESETQYKVILPMLKQE